MWEMTDVLINSMRGFFHCVYQINTLCTLNISQLYQPTIPQLSCKKDRVKIFEIKKMKAADASTSRGTPKIASTPPKAQGGVAQIPLAASEGTCSAGTLTSNFRPPEL